MKMNLLFKKIRKKIKKVFKILAKRPFVLALFFLLLGIILSTFIGYQYVILSPQEESFKIEKSFRFNEKEFLEVLKYYQTLQTEEKKNDLIMNSHPFRLW